MYIPGDFSASLEMIYKMGGKKGGGVENFFSGYESNGVLQNALNNAIDIFVDNAYDPDTGYSLFFNNCGDVAMQVISVGVLDNGKTVGEYRNEMLLKELADDNFPLYLPDPMPALEMAKLYKFFQPEGVY